MPDHSVTSGAHDDNSIALTDGARHSGRLAPDEAAAPTTETEGRLLALWEEVFGIDGLGVEDDYFALGGTSLMAARLFTAIAETFNTKLPLSTILAAPTVRALSHVLDGSVATTIGRPTTSAPSHDVDQPSSQRSKSLVELKRGGSRNLFLVHDGDGETLLYLNFARHMPADLSVVGVEPHRIPGAPLAQLSVEEMAAFYVGEIRRTQPNGPYLLGGLCAGGVIAFEMASQLVDAGESVGLVALLETAAPHAAQRTGRMRSNRLDRLTQALMGATSGEYSLVARAWTVLGVISRKLVNTVRWEIMQRLTKWSVDARFRLLRYVRARGVRWPRSLPALSVRQIYASAEELYVPKPLSGAAVVLVRAREGIDIGIDDTPFHEIYADDTFGWRGLADRLVVIDVNGGHSSMLQEPFVESLAIALAPFTAASASVAPPMVEIEIR